MVVSLFMHAFINNYVFFSMPWLSVCTVMVDLP